MYKFRFFLGGGERWLMMNDNIWVTIFGSFTENERDLEKYF